MAENILGGKEKAMRDLVEASKRLLECFDVSEGWPRISVGHKGRDGIILWFTGGVDDTTNDAIKYLRGMLNQYLRISKLEKKEDDA